MAVLWREEEHAGEVESERRVTKLMRWRYLWLRENTAELLDTSATWIGHGSGGLLSGGGDW